MKIARLMLQAFGPFSGETLDFVATPANLHVIYGANEAGKSSALRAMLDLRFGIPLRSSDDFIHASKDLRVAGVFIDATGAQIGLVRRKGRGQTLSVFDPSGGPDGDTIEATPEHARALSAGLQRNEFELMFGLDHARLREGGEQLLKGEGELGAALFAASAGTRDVAALQSALENDAKRYFNPHARTQNTVINGARNAIEQARRALREAQTRPDEWHRMNRAHQQARAELAAVDASLEAARRRGNELTELRAVGPLLARQDRLHEELQAYAGHPELAPDARERRLAAEQALARAAQDLARERAELERCDTALLGLGSDAVIITHADAVERLAAGIDGVARARIEVRQRQAEIASIEQDLAARVAQVAAHADLASILAAVPSAADRVILNQHLDAVANLRASLSSVAERIADLEARAQPEPDAQATSPAPALVERLQRALENAQALGKVSERLARLTRDGDEAERRLRHDLADLGMDSPATLHAARPLLDAEIARSRNDLQQTQSAIAKLREDQAGLQADLDERRLRERALAAEGEVVTAQTLAAARARRDAGWELIRQTYIEGQGDAHTTARQFDRDLPLPTAFAAAQQEADRQADLLRADAERAALLGDSLTRIAQMEAALAAKADELARQRAHEQTLRASWAARLAERGLPALDNDGLGEWQSRRAQILAAEAELTQRRAEQGRFEDEVRAAAQDLRAALTDAGVTLADPHDRGVGELLTDLASRAAKLLTAITERGAAAQERERSARRAAADLDKARVVQAEQQARLGEHESALADWLARMYLPARLDIAAFRARLAELDGIVGSCATLRDLQRQLAVQLALPEEFHAQAQALAALLGESAPANAEDFAARMRQRLQQTRSVEQSRAVLLRDQARARAARGVAERETAQQRAILDALCQAAAVAEVAKLPAAEAAAAERRRLAASLSEVRQHIAAASTRAESELRAQLHDLDAAAIESALEKCRADIERLEQAQGAAREVEEQSRHRLAAVDDSDQAAVAREVIEASCARLRAALRPWARLRLGHALLETALKRYRERAQGPMLNAASAYFALITGGRYQRLETDESGGQPVLRAIRADGRGIGLAAMSEGTADQLYLALRLAALELRRASRDDLPLVLDDVLITADDERAARIFQALEKFARGGQVMLFTHHRHLLDVARGAVDCASLAVHRL